jgi:hypothetical protein
LRAAGLCAAGFGLRFAPDSAAVAPDFAAIAPEFAAFAPAAVIAAVLEPPPRLALRWPGRDLGRLPSTPGSSLLSAATRGKIAPPAA